MNQAVHSRVEASWAEDINNKSSLKYINPSSLTMGTSHHIYSTVRNNQKYIQRAEVKARFLTGTYTLQGNRAAFNQHNVDPTCKLCKKEPETREHAISRCTIYDAQRSNFKINISALLPETRPMLSHVFNNDEFVSHFVLDCTLHDCVKIVMKDPFNKSIINSIELFNIKKILTLYPPHQN